MSTEENTMNPDDLAALRTAAEEGRKAKRELAFAKAGVDVDSPLGGLFMKGYDGEVTADAIKASWAEISPTTPEPAATEPAAQAPQAQAQHAVDPRVVIQQGGNADPAGLRPDLEAIHPGQLGARMVQEVRRDPSLAPGVVPEDMFFSSVFGAAVKGDPRVVGDPGRANTYKP
ncbi:MAG: hypothetical protein E6Q97_08925 [Desulfurellales bacterium]|nr:MAG: hypothetical protein E6Q97_08925 [Desulfurellales bacterium]